MGKAGKTAAAFARDLLRQVFDGYNPDGADIQELAVKHGLLVLVKYDPKRHDGEGAEFCEPGDPWYEFSHAMKTANAASKRRRDPSNA